MPVTASSRARAPCVEPRPLASELARAAFALGERGVRAQRLEPAVLAPVRQLPRRRWPPRCPRRGACRRARSIERQELVAVVDLAEQVLELLRGLHAALARPAEDRLGDLEDVAHALGGDPHVVEARLAGSCAACERVELVEPHRERSSRRLSSERCIRVELDLARLHARTSAASSSQALGQLLLAHLRRALRDSALVRLVLARRAARRIRLSIPGRSSCVRSACDRRAAARSSRPGRAARRARRPAPSPRAAPRGAASSGSTGAKISITARRRRVATRMSWTPSMSPVSITRCSCSHTSSARVPTASAAASRNGRSAASPGMSRALATYSARPIISMMTPSRNPPLQIRSGGCSRRASSASTSTPGRQQAHPDRGPARRARRAPRPAPRTARRARARARSAQLAPGQVQQRAGAPAHGHGVIDGRRLEAARTRSRDLVAHRLELRSARGIRRSGAARPGPRSRPGSTRPA